jgi:hypothetical protein
MTALRMAKGIADKIGVPYAVIDTEARSASKYADRFIFDVDNLESKTIDNYITSMNEANKAGYKVLVIDSLSHAWRELTDEVDRIAQKSVSKNAFSPWAKVNPKQKRFIDAILNYPGHIIATMRSKTEWVIGEGLNGKTAPEKMGLAPEQGKGIEYEFDLLVELNQHHQGIVTKDRTGKFQDNSIDRPDEDFGVALYDWLSGGNALLPSVSMPPTNTQPETAKEISEAQETTSANGELQSQDKAPKPKVTQTPETVKTANIDYKTAGEAVIKEIGEILNTVTAMGKPCFSEDEKAEARQLVTAVKADARGIMELKDFKVLLNDELTKREPQKAANSKAA